MKTKNCPGSFPLFVVSSFRNTILLLLQLVQKSFARLYYNDFLRNCRFVLFY
jgi:hypothetical protein